MLAELFFDYSCPYCRKGLAMLMDMLPDHPDIEIVWRPVEAHPRLEEPGHRPYVDIAVQGGLCVSAKKGNERIYAEELYAAWFDRREAIDDVRVLSACAVKAGVPADAFEAELSAGKFVEAQLAANAYAYTQQNVWAVPTLICGNVRLDAQEGMGVTRSGLERFLSVCTKKTTDG